MATMTRVTEDHKTVETVARAIYDSIKGCERGGYIGSFDRGHFISIDSNINLITAACAAIKAYRQVCETVPETHEGELKPCPFCGGKAIMDYIEPHTHSERLAKIMPDYKGGHFIECTGCTCALSLGNDRNAAIAAWNRREG